jgi:RNA polymerase sigma factor (sigma-70 family)
MQPAATVSAEEYAALLAKWAGWVFRRAKAWAHLADLDPEDVYSEAALIAWDWRERFDPARGAFATWAAICVRSAASRLRRHRARSVRAYSGSILPDLWEHRRDVDPTAPIDLAIAAEPDPVDEAAEHELLAAVRAVVDSLPPWRRELVRRRFFRDHDAPADRFSEREREGLAAALDQLRKALPAPERPAQSANL